MYTRQDVTDYVHQEDVRFIRLAFCDIFGRQKNVAVLADELPRAFDGGISFDASAIAGFGDAVKSDLFLHPDPSTFTVLPWRPSQGRVGRMYCDVRYPDGLDYERDSRTLLKRAVKVLADQGLSCGIGTELEFYLFKTDENGQPTNIPCDNAGYMDLPPEDKGENVRRDICLTLEGMGIHPETSHHEEGPGQNEIDFKYGDPLTAADNAITFKSVAKTIAGLHGLSAGFSPKPLKGQSGNGMHINLSVKSADGRDVFNAFMAGILEHIGEMTAFLNPTVESYTRLGEFKAPKYVTWSPENRSQLIRIPAVKDGPFRLELRSPDPLANPYTAHTLVLYAGLDGIKRNLEPPLPTNLNLFSPESFNTLASLKSLPLSFEEALKTALGSPFIRDSLPAALIDAFAGTRM